MIIGELIKSGKELLSEFIEDKDKLLEAETRLAELQFKLVLAQHETNKTEAGHRSVFVAGWRPFIGWICGSALLYNFVLRDLLSWGFALAGYGAEVPPAVELGPLMTILLGMLGLGGLRTYEKVKGKTI